MKKQKIQSSFWDGAGINPVFQCGEEVEVETSLYIAGCEPIID